MRRVALAAAATTAAIFPASAAADTTPSGPATLMWRWTGPVTAEGLPPHVLVAAVVDVGAGGKAGTIRIRASYEGVTAVGEPVHLPAEPGSYRFTAPHIGWDYRGHAIGFDQETGEHAVLSQKPCDPSQRFNDPCALERVDLFSPPGAAGEPTSVMKGAKLAVRGISETDIDQDLAGDVTEDRTDLQVSATSARDEDGRLRIAVTITNAGPRTADLPRISSPQTALKADGTCSGQGRADWFVPPGECPLANPIPVGASRTVTVVADSPGVNTATIKVASEGPDLADADNTVRVEQPPAARFQLTCAASQHLRRGVQVKVRGARNGRARVTLAFRNGTIKLTRLVTLKAGVTRTVTFKATGRQLRTLQRAGKRSVRARVTVRTIAGKAPTTTRTTVRL